jgi:hypothetical protein
MRVSRGFKGDVLGRVICVRQRHRLGRAADFSAAASPLEAYADDCVVRGRRIDVVKQKVATVGTSRIRGGVAGPTTLEFPRHEAPYI